MEDDPPIARPLTILLTALFAVPAALPTAFASLAAEASPGEPPSWSVELFPTSERSDEQVHHLRLSIGSPASAGTNATWHLNAKFVEVDEDGEDHWFTFETAPGTTEG